MPKLTTSLPRYRHHKASGQAVVTLNGRDHYLGPYRSKVSRREYDRLVSEWLACGRQSAPSYERSFTVSELIYRYWQFAKQHYRKPDGTPTGTAENIRPALRTLREMYGDSPANEFGPIALKAVRQRFIDDGQSRRSVNENTSRIKSAFRWALSEELIDDSVVTRLSAVEGLRKGKADARETEPVTPVSDEIVEQTLLFLPDVVADMVRIAKLTGARPGEICSMRPCEIDRKGTCWIYIPGHHKTEHHDKSRAVPIGPKAQEVLRPYLERDERSYCFQPSEAVERYRATKHANRKTPMSCGTTRGSRQRQRGRKKSRQAPLGECYTNNSFRRAIHRACDRAFPPPEPLAQRDGETAAARDRRLNKQQKKELARWHSKHRWSPNQLRHSAATSIRELYGIEAVAAVLGHSRTDTSEIYALRNLQLATQVAVEIG